MRKRWIVVGILIAVLFAQVIIAADCISVPLAPGNWQQPTGRFGSLEQAREGLLVRGDAWTNGGWKNGKTDGNAIISANSYSLENGGDVYMTFAVNGGGKYLAVWPNLFTGVKIPHMSTHHSWAGSVVLPENTWIFAHLKVQPDGKYRITICLNNYDDRGGRILLDRSGVLASKNGRVEISFVDNYASRNAYLLIKKVEVCPNPGHGGGGGGRGTGTSGSGNVFVAGSGGDQAASIWYVGSRPSKYRVNRIYCAIASQGSIFSASYKLTTAGFHSIVFGPATFAECVTWIESSNNRWWPVSEDWYIGSRLDADGVYRYSLASDSPHAPASSKLATSGFATIVFGPATWQDCVDWLVARGVPGW